MKKYKYLSIGVITLSLLGASSCKKDLQVGNPNSPTVAQANTESGIISLALGAVYINGFNFALGPVNNLGDSYFSNAIQFQELLGDDISSEDANQNINIINLPDWVQLDPNDASTKEINQSPNRSNSRINNTRDKRSSNAFYYEWAYMYSLNNACNNLLDVVNTVSFSGDAATKKATITAWAYWWKGFAYSKIGSLYYSGLINNVTNGVNSNYVSHTAIIAESNRCFGVASGILGSIASVSDYNEVLSQLIPAFCQVDHGGVPTPTMWIHNINTMEARNLLANKQANAIPSKTNSEMAAADWATLLTLTTSGIQQGDVIFNGVTTGINGFFSAGAGSVAAQTTLLNTKTTFKITERLIQEYKSGDKRLPNNFDTKSLYLNQVGGLLSSTRWSLDDGGNGLDGTIVLSDRTPGNYELYIAGSYEENELMKAEALINTGSIDLGLASVDNVRTYQGAGLAAVSGTGLSLAAAQDELRRERRVALVFRGLAFYDARRWGVTYDISTGGGRTGAVVLSSTGTLYTNSTINYDFLDYWDVPADESVLNPPASGSSPIKNPNY
jgi:starch-binding outer membrane protein, SusD/RagB family